MLNIFPNLRQKKDLHRETDVSQQLMIFHFYRLVYLLAIFLTNWKGFHNDAEVLKDYNEK
jgi:hypothetical protein